MTWSKELLEAQINCIWYTATEIISHIENEFFSPNFHMAWSAFNIWTLRLGNNGVTPARLSSNILCQVKMGIRNIGIRFLCGRRPNSLIWEPFCLLMHWSIFSGLRWAVENLTRPHTWRKKSLRCCSIHYILKEQKQASSKKECGLVVEYGIAIHPLRHVSWCEASLWQIPFGPLVEAINAN